MKHYSKKGQNPYVSMDIFKTINLTGEYIHLKPHLSEKNSWNLEKLQIGIIIMQNPTVGHNLMINVAGHCFDDIIVSNEKYTALRELALKLSFPDDIHDYYKFSDFVDLLRDDKHRGITYLISTWDEFVNSKKAKKSL
jgi:hypothetical protein